LWHRIDGEVRLSSAPWRRHSFSSPPLAEPPALRVVSMNPSLTSILVALGAEDVAAPAAAARREIAVVTAGGHRVEGLSVVEALEVVRGLG
jgi:hypothetical protein